MPSARGPVTRAAVITHGKVATIGPALDKLQAVAEGAGVHLVVSPDEALKHGIAQVDGDDAPVDLVVVLGGDGTMLRALTRYLGRETPVIGVNFGRVGFLSSMQRDELEDGMRRVFAGDYEVVELATIEVECDGGRFVAVNDAVVTSGTLGRMVELDWAVGGEGLGVQPCDGVICATPSGSTAYNLSNGGPVLVWGIDALTITFVAPHSLHARPLVVPRGSDVVICNRTADVPAVVLVDGHRTGEVAPLDGTVVVRLGPARSLLATLPEATFVRRYRKSFAS